jgi:hypothetical protein
MRRRSVYATLCVAGTILPYWQLLPFLLDHGADIRLFFAQAFANRVSGAFAIDVMVSSVVLWVFVAAEGRRLGMKHLWMPIVANIAVGVCLGLPLFLYFREAHLPTSLSRPRAGG